MSKQIDYVVTTGDFIEEWLESTHLTQVELAHRLGVTKTHVSELVSGKAPLSHDVALGLKNVSGIPARIWNQYEAGYREDLARIAK